jgi:hypothetical protein
MRGRKDIKIYPTDISYRVEELIQLPQEVVLLKSFVNTVLNLRLLSSTGRVTGKFSTGIMHHDVSKSVTSHFTPPPGVEPPTLRTVDDTLLSGESDNADSDLQVRVK